jgi:hypothetical protein
MKPELRAPFRESLKSAKSHYASGEYEAAFASLETAHVLGQQFLLPHMVVHIWMLRVGAARRDKREIFGQIIRLVATVPGFIFGWVPLGNTGGANVSALKPMPVPDALASLVPEQKFLREFGLRLVALLGLVLIWRQL